MNKRGIARVVVIVAIVVAMVIAVAVTSSTRKGKNRRSRDLWNGEEARYWLEKARGYEEVSSLLDTWLERRGQHYG